MIIIVGTKRLCICTDSGAYMRRQECTIFILKEPLG